MKLVSVCVAGKMQISNLFTTSESPKYSNLPIFCCLQNFVFFSIKSRAKYCNQATFSNSDCMGVQFKALKYVIQIKKKKFKTIFFGQLDNSNSNILQVLMSWTSYLIAILSGGVEGLNQVEANLDLTFKKTHAFFLESRVVWFKKDLCKY